MATGKTESAGVLSLSSASVEETERLGESLAPCLETGDVVALRGVLGAGKTRFVAGVARGLEARARVRSPSFALINEYRGRLLLLHLDLYRLEPGETSGLGLDEQLERGVMIVEWAERLDGHLLDEALDIEIERVSENERRLRAHAAAGRGAELLRAWRARVTRANAEAGESA